MSKEADLVVNAFKTEEQVIRSRARIGENSETAGKDKCISSF